MLKPIALATAAVLAASSAHAAAIGTVFVIALENHNFTQPPAVTAAGLGQVFGNPAAPFINSLITPGNPNAAMASYASNYTNVPPQAGQPIHPSEPNYVWAEAGKAGPLNDNQPYPNNIVSGPSLSATLQASGQSWRSYQEGIDLATVNGQLTNTVLPAGQHTVPLTNFSGTSSTYTNPYNGSNQYNYAAKHDPQVFFTATNGGNDPSASNPQAKFYSPLEQLSTDLTNNTVAQYNWITPDQYNDMHTALTGGFTYNGVHYTGNRDLALGEGQRLHQHHQLHPLLRPAHLAGGLRGLAGARHALDRRRRQRHGPARSVPGRNHPRAAGLGDDAAWLRRDRRRPAPSGLQSGRGRSLGASGQAGGGRPQRTPPAD